MYLLIQLACAQLDRLTIHPAIKKNFCKTYQYQGPGRVIVDQLLPVYTSLESVRIWPANLAKQMLGSLFHSEQRVRSSGFSDSHRNPSPLTYFWNSTHARSPGLPLSHIGMSDPQATCRDVRSLDGHAADGVVYWVGEFTYITSRGEAEYKQNANNETRDQGLYPAECRYIIQYSGQNHFHTSKLQAKQLAYSDVKAI